MPSDHLIRQMISIMRHRGPDKTGVYIDDDIHLGHCRLSILGLKTGDQPIAGKNGRTWIVYNGEVFNYLELKSDLEKKGHKFITDTDTEVVLRLYEEMGPACLLHLNGQFALAIRMQTKRSFFWPVTGLASARFITHTLTTDWFLPQRSRRFSWILPYPGKSICSPWPRYLPAGPPSGKKPFSKIFSSFVRAITC